MYICNQKLLQIVNCIDNLQKSAKIKIMIKRQAAHTLASLSRGFPVVTVTGPRQSGKTTLVRDFFSDKPYVSLEELDQREYATTDPRGFLASYPDGAVLDEVQNCPELFSYIQGTVDKDKRCGLFILTGSQQFGLLSRITQSLAGRAGFVHLLPFALSELQEAGRKTTSLDSLLFSGLYPPLYDRDVKPPTWHANYILTYLERDVRQMVNVRDLTTFQRFLKMCAARNGQLLNLSSLANDCGITHNTAKAWISILEASYIVFLLTPHHKNFGKRLVKSPKLYFHDTGLAAYLLGIQNAEQFSIHSMRGALFEGFVISQLLKSRYNRGLASNLCFWRDSTGNEIDLIMEKGEKLEPLEIKSGQTITRDYFKGIDKWLVFAGETAGPARIVYGGKETQLRTGVEVIPWQAIGKILP